MFLWERIGVVMMDKTGIRAVENVRRRWETRQAAQEIFYIPIAQCLGKRQLPVQRSLEGLIGRHPQISFFL